MNELNPTEIEAKLQAFGQQHLLQFRDQLSDEQLHRLLKQIQDVDLSLIELNPEAKAEAEQSAAGSTRVQRAAAPQGVIGWSDEDRAARAAAEPIGSQLLAAGKVAVITVAGGQGSRLKFEHPKGMFPIGPRTDRTLFRVFAEQIQARRRTHDAPIDWYLMTSAATHQETVAFFEQQDYFGLGPDTVRFFQQASMPAIDAQSGRILMDGPDSLCLSPDGHGGMVTALKASGCLDLMKQNGVEHLFYHQVDNPTVIMCDPVLLGLHAQQQSQLTTCVVKKTGPDERMGVLVDLDGRTEIIEYSELGDDDADRHDDSGQWVFWAGNTAIHIFRRDFLEYLTEDGSRLPLHLAHKEVPHIDDSGQVVTPTAKNAFKFERFIFDALPQADTTLMVEGDREREFNPVKNRTGADSPATARAALSRIGRQWLSHAGHELKDGAVVEISPLIALSAEELAERLTQGDITLEDLVG